MEEVIPSTSSGNTGKPRSNNSAFNIDSNQISSSTMQQQDSELQDLGITAYNQDEFEQGVMQQVDQALAKEEKARFERIQQKEMKNINEDILTVEQELRRATKILENSRQQDNAEKKLASLRCLKNNKESQLKTLKAKKKSLNSRLLRMKNSVVESDMDTEGKSEDNEEKILEEAFGLSKRKETAKEKMIRLGEMTPFGTVLNTKRDEGSASEFGQFLLGQGQSKLINKKKSPAKIKRPASTPNTDISSKVPKLTKSNSFSNLKQNRFDAKDKRVYKSTEKDFSNYRTSRRRFSLQHGFSGDGDLSDHGEFEDEDLHGHEDLFKDEELFDKEDSNDKNDTISNVKKNKSRKIKEEDEDWNASDIESANEEDVGTLKLRYSYKRKSSKDGRDDGSLKMYEERLKQWRKQQLKIKQRRIEDGEEISSDEDEEFDGGLLVPGKIWKKLYKYQRTGVRWLWELHLQLAGGIVGDEMGLGKTIQIIAFLAALRHSKLRDKGAAQMYHGLGPVLVICPATVMHQWVKEFHTWAPVFRVAVLHSSGSYSSSSDKLVRSIIGSNGVIVTSYSSMLVHQDSLLKYDWHYAVLDEGHKIRNPDAQVTHACKQIRTSHRLILSGSPVQNNLKELWSLFDFVFPGKLGTLPDFMSHFSVPIVQGGYANATQVQVQTAYKCACILRDTISPYLLRRMKADVRSNLTLPNKNEQVLFCRLTDEQREVYQEYLDSKECKMILNGQFMVFPGLITLRKICNHPDISTGGPNELNSFTRERFTAEQMAYGHKSRSGKMIVVDSLLKLWKKQGNRVLLFSQSRHMLDILEQFVKSQSYTYMRMDGTTSIGSRQPLINRFNQDANVFVFLLTTRVGGLGVNLIGANRIIIFDPDWNPSTDTQARERAWRIGQERPVTIYRLLTTGTIEEKIYHRQIFKTFLTNRVLKDPKQRRFFKSNDLYELFSLNDDSEGKSETSAIFAGTGSDVSVKRTPRNQRKNFFDTKKERDESQEIEENSEDEDMALGLSKDRMEELRQLAKKLSQKLVKEDIKVDSDKTTKPVKTEIKTDVTEAPGKSLEMPGIKHTKQSSSHRKKKKKRDAKIDGERISYLVKQKKYKAPKDKEMEQDESSQDNYVLSKLMKKSGLHSAMQHDTIMQSSNPDFALVEVEATRVANEAVKALRKSRSHCYSAREGIPSWTGQTGHINNKSAPPKPRFGKKKSSLLSSTLNAPSTTTSSTSDLVKSKESCNQSPNKIFDGTISGNTKTTQKRQVPAVMTSEDLLSRMHERNFGSKTEDIYDDDMSSASRAKQEEIDLITDIRNFVAFGASVDGQATTTEVLDQFQAKVQIHESAMFKQMLKKICDFHKLNGIGVWKLKPEFR